VKRILILSGIQLSANPRVVKEASTLANAGYSVEVLGVSREAALVQRDRQLLEGTSWKYTSLMDASSRRLSDRLRILTSRARLRFWGEVYALTGLSNPRQVGIAVPEMLQYSLQHPADLYILHNPDSLWVGVELLRRGEKIGVDVEDWYSEDLLPEDRRNYPVKTLRAWESTVLRGAAYSTTTSRSLSEALSVAYVCEPPGVVYNSFPLRDRDRIDGRIRDRINPDLPSLCWFSQVIGPGRGLETLFDALGGVDVLFEIHLRGNITPDYKGFLLSRVPARWRELIHFHEQVPHSELISRIAEHDVGFAGEIPFCRSRDLTVTNKLPFYLLAGLAVIASDTEGQREIAALANEGVVSFEADNSEDLSTVLDDLLGDRERLRLAKENARVVAEQYLCWERSAPVLVERIDEVLGAKSKTDRDHVIV
jgi:glycosyltransferase involved in cell wall biosynthesis